MSTLSYRNWDIWINTGSFEIDSIYEGYFECTILGGLMIFQTIEFLAERYEIHGKIFQEITRPPIEIIKQATTTEEGHHCIRIYDSLNTPNQIKEKLRKIVNFVEAIGMAVDAPLSCPRIRFFANNSEKILVANRRSIGRGFAFEIDERGVAAQKIQKDMDFYQNATDTHLLVGRRHYLAGMQLLSLEDQVSGLIDAAFMQFYQGCEALCKDSKGGLEPSQKYIACSGATDQRELQIIAHQIWRVRNKYFGHGDVNFNLNANLTLQTAAAVAKQVLVARYLCRRLIDIQAPSSTSLIREMGLYFDRYSGNFTGQLAQLENDFRVEFDNRISKIYDSSGTKIEEYSIA